MNFNLKLKKIRTFRKMTQKELSEKIGLTDQHRIVQYEKGVRVPKKDLVDKMAQALDVNPYTLYDTAGRDASEMMELLFWLDEFNPSALHLFLPRKFPGEKSKKLLHFPLSRSKIHFAFTRGLCAPMTDFRQKEVNSMKEGIHPNYQQTTITCACGNVIETGSTKKDIKVEVCSKCHPFYTGKQKMVDTGGRVSRFNKKFGLE